MTIADNLDIYIPRRIMGSHAVDKVLSGTTRVLAVCWEPIRANPCMIREITASKELRSVHLEAWPKIQNGELTWQPI